MKQVLSEEFRRMQRLAGLITESEYKLDEEETPITPEAEENAEEGLKKALSSLKSSINSVKPSPKDKELNEIEPISLTAGLVASAPGLMSILGNLVNIISSPFLKDKQTGTIVGNALVKAGHELEDDYLRFIANLLKKGFPSTYPMEYEKNNALGKAAKGIYITILTAAGINAAMSATTAHSLIVKGIEGGLSAMKGAEAIELASYLAKAA